MAWWIHALSGVLAISLIGLFLWYGRTTRRWETELLHSEKLIGLGRLSATIAHEIRNPLGIIKATAQRLEHLEKQDAPAEKRAELLRFIPEEVNRLDRIVTRYLRAGQTDASHPVPTDVSRELPKWIEALDGRERVKSSIADTEPILADPEAPRQVLTNLIRNALEASPEGSSVEIEWREDRGRIGVLRVRDHGPGIPKKLRGEVFEPFRTTKATGSGLGLYAAKALVERDGGTISIEDNDGGGAVFVVKWPLVIAESWEG
jgi:signal transduction histidine kinase